MTTDIGRVTSVVPAPEEKRIYVSVKLSPDEYIEEIPFATGKTGLWMVPEEGDIVEVYEVGFESYVARTPHNPTPLTMPDLSQGDFCLKLNENTELTFSKQADDTFNITLAADGEISADAHTVRLGDEVYDSSGTNLADKVFHAEGTNTDINSSNNISWNTTAINDVPYSFDGTTVTIQESGTYEIEADADFTSNVARTNANIGIRVNGNWAGVVGRSGYVRDNTGHNASSVHTRSIQDLSSGDTVRIHTIQEAASETIVPDRAQFSIKKLSR